MREHQKRSGGDRPAFEGLNKKSLHDWALSPKQAIALQKELATLVELSDRFPPGGRRVLKHIAGLDVAFEDGGKVTRGAVVVLRMKDRVPIASAVARRPTVFPYIPGLLSFHEVPVLLDALAMLGIAPDILMCDGHGIAHPRRFGSACHLGLLTDLPAIGVGKSRLTGSHEEPGPEKGDWIPLVANPKGSAPKGGGRAARQAAREFPPGAMAVFACDVEAWADLAPGAASLRNFVTPSDIRFKKTNKNSDV